MSEDDLSQRIRTLSDEQIVRIISVDSAQYRQEAIDFAKAEAERRQLYIPDFDVSDSSALAARPLVMPVGCSLIVFALLINVLAWFYMPTLQIGALFTSLGLFISALILYSHRKRQ